MHCGELDLREIAAERSLDSERASSCGLGFVGFGVLGFRVDASNVNVGVTIEEHTQGFTACNGGCMDWLGICSCSP